MPIVLSDNIAIDGKVIETVKSVGLTPKISAIPIRPFLDPTSSPSVANITIDSDYKYMSFIHNPSLFNNLERMYPPVRDINSTNHSITGQAYGNGFYVTSFTSSYSSFPPFRCFNIGDGVGGHWIDAYTSPNGTFNLSTNIVSGYNGDWLKIKFPVAINLTKYAFQIRTDFLSRSPKDFKIYGSNNEINWIELTHETNPTYVNGLYERNITTTGTYNSFGLVVNKIMGSTVLNFDEWYIYGIEDIPQAPYTITFNDNTECDILIVGGGGGGGAGHGGGGGAGQLVFIHNAILNGNYNITVGKGGIGGRSNELVNSFPASKGFDSSFSTVIAEAGGANTNVAIDKNGGSGAGGDGYTTDGGTGGFGVKNSNVDTFSARTVYSRGNDGANISVGGKGGGGGGSGFPGSNENGGNGLSGIIEINYDFRTNFGTGIGQYIAGEDKVYFAGGGSGGNTTAVGGKGGGGAGTNSGSSVISPSGVSNTGSGGGGGSGGSGTGGDGGSGIVIVRYKTKSIFIPIPKPIPISINDGYSYIPFFNSDANQKLYSITFSENTECDILVVGGGGAGGNSMGGGGGAGGVVYTVNQIMNGTYTIGVGMGGLGLPLTDADGDNGAYTTLQDGSDSFIRNSGNTADISLNMGGTSQNLRGFGGGGGGVYYNNLNGRNGGSGGGCSENNPNFSVNLAGISTQPNTFWNGTSYIKGGSSGNVNTTTANDYQGGGGGGAGGLQTNSHYTNGKTGVSLTITGTSENYAGGGGAGQYTAASISQGLGGSSVGGVGRVWNGSSYLRDPTSGINGTGSGGGGGAYLQNPDIASGSGGSGIVIIRYKTNAPFIQINNEYKYIPFFNNGSNQTSYSITFPEQTECDILIVGGGGGGDGQIGGGGGGGAVLYAQNVIIPSNTYTINVGNGGAENNNGFASTAFGATCLGGGSTLRVAWTTPNNGRSGGSGSGGSAGSIGTAVGVGGGVGISTKGSLLATGNLYNGNAGGTGGSYSFHTGGGVVCSGGGGGANEVGKSTTNTVRYNNASNYNAWFNAGAPGSGGDGILVNITGTDYFWGGGGGGGSHETLAGTGGLGGGGGGSQWAGTTSQLGGIGINNGSEGVPNGKGGDGGASTGGGGGGGGWQNTNGGRGGSGIVIIRYKIIKEPYNAQWTYSSTNPSVYYLGNVGIGTTNPTSALSVVGSVSASIGISALSKSFKIEHPLNMNKWLYHGCVEAPRFDNIYRGKKIVTNGQCEVDIDRECNKTGGMTEGTFIALNTNLQLYLRNNQTFDGVKGTIVDGKIIINCQNTTDEIEIDWLIIGERKDENVINVPLTSIEGNLICEHNID